MTKFTGNIVDVVRGEIYPGVLEVSEGRISNIERVENDSEVATYILPGFVDSHIHIESTMLTPSRFAQAVVPRGTVAVVTDPHEIANVMGMEGIEYMRRDASQAPLKTYFTAPSCVPATPYETNGANLGPREIGELFRLDNVVALGEVMNYHGVIKNDRKLLVKIALSKAREKPIDGHCPGLSGWELKRYVSAGISTDHECTTLEEAQEKSRLGMKIMIREGSSAKNLEALVDFKGDGFLVSDDKHTEDLLNEGHMDYILSRAVELGMDPMRAIRMVTLNPVKHYGLDVGLLRVGDPADFVIVDDLENFTVRDVWIRGNHVASEGIPLFSVEPEEMESSYNLPEKKPEDFIVKANKNQVKAKVIKIFEGQILTQKIIADLPVDEGIVLHSVNRDILKLSVLERYTGENMANAFVKGFGFKKGALASSIAHDSHNVVAVGTDHWDMAIAVNIVSMMQGGLAAVYDKRVIGALKLPVGGIMSTEAPDVVAKHLKNLTVASKAMGCKISSPFTTLSFLSLLVIPELRLSDLGLFDVESFGFTGLLTND